jgi:hypothetical protein
MTYSTISRPSRGWYGTSDILALMPSSCVLGIKSFHAGSWLHRHHLTGCLLAMSTDGVVCYLETLVGRCWVRVAGAASRAVVRAEAPNQAHRQWSGCRWSGLGSLPPSITARPGGLASRLGRDRCNEPQQS